MSPAILNREKVLAAFKHEIQRALIAKKNADFEEDRKSHV